MKNHLLGLYTAVYLVENLERSRKWYAAMLGKEPYFDQPFYVGFQVGGYELGLMPLADTLLRERGCIAYWGVADISAARGDLAAAGHTLYEEIREVGEGIKVASFIDRDGNVIGLIENPHFPDTVHA